MAQLFQRPALLGTECRILDLDMVGQILMMEPWTADPLLHRPAGHRFQGAEQHHADDAAAAGCTEHRQLVLIFQHRWRHARQRTFARGDGIGLAAFQAIAVAAIRVGGKIIHLVVQQHTGAGHGEGGAEGQVDAQGGGHGVTLAVDQREMRGVGAFMEGDGGAQLQARRGPLRIDTGGQSARVID